MTLRTATYDDSKFKIVPIESTEQWIDNLIIKNGAPSIEMARSTMRGLVNELLAAAPEYQEPIPAKVILFNGVTSLDLNPNHILEAAKDRCEGVIVIGFKTDNEGLYASSSYADGGTVLWLIEKFKLNLLTGNHDEQSG